MLDEITRIQEDLDAEIAGADTREALEQIRIKFLGKKGRLTALMRSLGEVPAGERPQVGQRLNKLKKRAEQLLAEKQEAIKNNAIAGRWDAERIDVTLPGFSFAMGRRHPLQVILQEIEEIFTSMGFKIAEGPDIEYDYYNFEALNIPREHPARDMQDSYYISSDILLRTHTSPVQIRTMEAMQGELPVRIIAPGKVYRRDDDVTHSPMFHQVEGLAVDKHITMADLKGTLLLFVREMFGGDREIRLRPSYFPFTEPSAEVDISCIICDGRGCRVCSETGWLEILGSGMVHRRVLEMSGYDPNEVTGYAFGMGVERIAMLKYGIDDIRLFYHNDLRMLEQY